MEPISVLATTAIGLLFSEAIKETGKNLGKAVTDQLSHLFTLVRKKFQMVGTEGLLNRAEQQPTEPNIRKVTDELEIQLNDDKNFHTEVQALVGRLEQAGLARQIILSDSTFKGKLEAGDISQTKEPGTPGEQIIGSNLDVGGDAKFGNLTQKG